MVGNCPDIEDCVRILKRAHSKTLDIKALDMATTVTGFNAFV